MSEFSMSELAQLERALEDVGRRLEFPPEPQLATAVRARIERRPVPASRFERLLASARRPAFAAAAAVVAACVFLMASPSARVAVADFLGLDDVRITYGDPPARRVGEGLGLGERVSLDEVAERAGFDVLLPEELGTPDDVYFHPRISGGQVGLVYAPRESLPASGGGDAGAVITEFEATLDDEYFEKVVRFQTGVTEMTVNGGRGFYVDEPHTLFYRDESGAPRQGPARLVASTLVWEQEGLVLRIEADLGRAEMLSIAESMS